MPFFQYSTPRVDSDANYWERPYALVDASWATPWSFRVEARLQHGRCRAITGEVHETDLLLWTPNATTIPYFAGLYRGSPVPEEEGNPASFAADRARRRFDGHLGPDDGYEYPQYYDPARPWMCLIRRPTRELTDTTASYAFFHPYYAQMDPEAERQRLPESLVKRFKQEEESLEQQEKEAVVALDTFCSFLRYAVEPPPHRYSAEQLHSLVEDELTWEDMVDTFALIQRGMRERWAWWKYVSLLMEYGRLPWDKDERDAVTEQLGALALLPADESYLGAWFNSADEVQGRWMMLIARVPAYFSSDLPDNGRKDAEKYASFGPATLPTRSVLQRKIPGAKAAKWRTTEEVPRETPELPHANRVARARVRPASLGLTGWRKLDYPAAKDAVGRKHGVVCPPQLRNVFEQGHWDYFVEWYSEESETPGNKNEPNCGYSKPVWLRVGKGSKRRSDAEGCKIIYERTMKRQYYVDSYPIIEGMEHDINVWGVPLPPWEHYAGDKLESVLKRGVWGYTTEKPTSDLVGNKWEAPSDEPPPSTAPCREDWATANTSSWEESCGDPYLDPRYGAPEDVAPPKSSTAAPTLPLTTTTRRVVERSTPPPVASGSRSRTTTLSTPPAASTSAAQDFRPPRPTREQRTQPRSSRPSASTSYRQRGREAAEEIHRTPSRDSQSAVANAYASRNAARTPATRPPTEPRRDRVVDSRRREPREGEGRAAIRADPPAPTRSEQSFGGEEGRVAARDDLREPGAAGSDASVGASAVTPSPAFVQIRLTLLAPAVDVGRLADLATVMNRAGIAHDALVRTSASGREFVARFASTEQASQAIMRLPALSTEEAEVAATRIPAAEAESLIANATIARDAAREVIDAMEVDNDPQTPVFPPLAHPFAGLPPPSWTAPAGILTPTPAFGSSTFPVNASFQWPAAPWGIQPSPSPFAAQPQMAPLDWQLAFPQLSALLQQAPWLFAPGWGSLPAMAQTQLASTPMAQADQSGSGPSGAPAAPSTASSVTDNATPAPPTTAPRPPTAPRAMRTARPDAPAARLSLHSRIAGAPPIRTLQERLAGSEPSQSVVRPAAKRPAASLLDRLAAGETKRARPSPPSPSSSTVPPAQPTTSASAASGEVTETADRKHSKRGGGAGNRRRRRRRARRLAQTTEGQSGGDGGHESDREEGEYDDADDFVHRPDSPGSGAAM